MLVVEVAPALEELALSVVVELSLVLTVPEDDDADVDAAVYVVERKLGSTPKTRSSSMLHPLSEWQRMRIHCPVTLSGKAVRTAPA